MADVRVNKRRMPTLKAVDSIGGLVSRLETVGESNRTYLTTLMVNGRQIDIDNPEIMRLKLESDDTVEALMETPQQLSYQSLQVAQDMAELLIFDLKVATLQIWDGTKNFEKSLETLLGDCKLFLTLAARPIELLNQNPYELPQQAESCLRQLDATANNLEDAVLLAVNGKNKESCQVLVARVLPCIERWLSLAVPFANHLQIEQVELPTFRLKALLMKTKCAFPISEPLGIANSLFLTKQNI